MPNKKEDDKAYWDRQRPPFAKARNGRRNPHPGLLPSEDPAAHATLVAEYYRHFNPTRPEERGYVDDIIYCEWSLRRLRRTLTELNTYIHQDAAHTHPDFPLGQPAALNPGAFNALEYRFISVRKALKQALFELKELRANPIPDRIPEEVPEVPAPEPPVTQTIETTSPEIGFVFGTCPVAPAPGSPTSHTGENMVIHPPTPRGEPSPS